MPKTKSIANNSLFNIIYTCVNIFFPLIASMYVSRIILVEGVGRVSYAQNIASYFVTLAALGLPTYGVREIAKSRYDQKRTNNVFTELFIINAVSTTVAVLTYLLIIFNVTGFAEERRLFLCCGLLIFFNYINVDWFYRGQEEYCYIACRSIVIKLLSLIALLAFVRTQQDYVIFALINSLAIGGNNIFNIVYARKFVKVNFHGLNFRKHLGPLFILSLNTFLSRIYSKVDITMLGMLSTETATGYYAYAHKTVEVVTTACVAISTVFLPRLSFYYNNDKKKFMQLIDLGIQVLSFIAIPASAGFFMLAPQIMVLLYGNAFSPAAFTVKIFSPFIIIRGFGDLLCYQLIICTGNEKQQLPAYLLGAIANILLNAAFIPLWAQNGAAIASLISELILNLYQFLHIRKLIMIPINKNVLWQATVSTLLMSIAIYLILQLQLSLLPLTILAIVVGILVYFVMSYFMKNALLQMFIKKANNRIHH